MQSVDELENENNSQVIVTLLAEELFSQDGSCCIESACNESEKHVDCNTFGNNVISSVNLAFSKLNINQNQYEMKQHYIGLNDTIKLENNRRLNSAFTSDTKCQKHVPLSNSNDEFISDTNIKSNEYRKIKNGIDELFEKFFNKLCKVVLKTEIRWYIKNITLLLMHEMRNIDSCIQSNSFPLESTNFNSVKNEQNESENVLIVESENNDQLKYYEQSNEQISVNRNSENSPKSDTEKLYTDKSDINCQFENKLTKNNSKSTNNDFDNKFRDETNSIFSDNCYISHRAVGTSPIQFPDDISKKLFSSLNCISRQNKNEMLKNKKPLVRKQKSLSQSLLYRIFNRNKSKRKEHYPAYYTTYSNDSSNLSLDQYHVSINYSNRCSPNITCDSNSICSSVDLNNKESLNFNRIYSRDSLLLNEKYQPQQTTTESTCENSGAVFIID